MTTETFTESERPVMPVPRDVEEAIGWVIRVDYDNGTSLTGVVRGKSFTRLEVQFEGECPRACCLEDVKFEHANFIGLVECECGSGQPAVLCLCEDTDDEEVESDEPVRA